MTRVAPWRSENDELTGVGRLLKEYKFQGRTSLGPVLAEWLGESIRNADWFGRIEGIVPVPTHWARRLRRPFYAPEELAELTSRNVQIPVAPLLRRVRGGRRQIGLTYTERMNNIRGAFSLRRGVSLVKARLLLLDDVKTTGATLSECARVLRKSGATELYAAVIASAGFRHLSGQKILGV